MIDVVVIGAGVVGLEVASTCLQHGLNVLLVDDNQKEPGDWQGNWVYGKAVMAGPGLVAILDVETGDERRVISTHAVVLACEVTEFRKSSARMRGISKLGLGLKQNSDTYAVNDRGETGAPGIFATGDCAAGPTPDLFKALLDYCVQNSMSNKGA